MKKLKVLFFGEGATLAHVVRPLMLAKGLDANLFDVALCRPRNLAGLTNHLPFSVLDLTCQDASVFARRLARGLPLYDYPTLCRYVEEDLALIEQEEPDIIVGDFRLSLSVSARLKSTPYITICDAYWSPERPLKPALPVLALTRYAPLKLAEFCFRQIAPWAFRLHTLPVEKLRRKYDLPSLGHDLRRCYSDADLRLFANFPALFPEVKTHEGADFIGPIAWSPDFHGNLDFLAGNGPLAYVTLGSSGNPEVIKDVIPILEAQGSRVVITTAGKHLPYETHSSQTHVFDYLPGAEVCRHANLVICNGGSPTTNQALSNGVPVIGIASNMDQFLNMETITEFGAGQLVRADRATPSCLRSTIEKLFRDHSYTTRARHLAKSLGEYDYAQTLTRHIFALSKKI